MELVFRKDVSLKDNFYDLYVVLGKDGSVKLTIRSKNGTGESSFALTPEDFDMLCEIRAKVKKDSEN